MRLDGTRWKSGTVQTKAAQLGVCCLYGRQGDPHCPALAVDVARMHSMSSTTMRSCFSGCAQPVLQGRQGQKRMQDQWKQSPNASAEGSHLSTCLC